ncbi:MgtC/SapB family protein [Methanolobus sp. ZRKC2]|uniref:MgtC/SapB family protein n=1 Tax=Methanolobus sp. ZRKC2 TaxID=3125783 RepID=UPI003245CAB1
MIYTTASFSVDPFLLESLEKIGISLLIGVLIGLERESWRSDKKIFAGVRTFTITCIMGTISAFLADFVGYAILIITTIFIGLCCIFLMYEVNVVQKKSGLTTAVALFSTYLLGILVAQGFFQIAIIVAVIITFLLIEKRPLHSLAENLSERDIIDALQFVAIAFILYPIVPDEPIYGGVSLKAVILIVVLVSAVSFVSYILLKRTGTKGGIAYSGFLGGLASSEAAIVALSNISKKKQSLIENVFVGSLLTVIAMAIRDVIIALLIDTSGRVSLLMIPPFLIMSLVTFLMVWRKKNITPVEETIYLRSPFAIGPALKFGILFTIVLAIANVASSAGGPLGTYAAALGGIASSSAVTASMASLAVAGKISYQTAAETAVLAGIISTLSKPLYIKLVGANELFRKVVYYFILISLIGFVILMIWGEYIL